MDILNELHSITKLRGDTYSSAEVIGMIGRAAAEIERLQGKVAYWQNLSLQAAEIERLRLALRIIAGREQCIDNLMSNVDVACEALDN